MASVKFLQGSQANLNNLIANGGAIKDAFYLTNDSHRLYIGCSNGEKIVPVAINRDIAVVDTAAGLDILTPFPGDFVYITEGNILAVYDGTQWVQVNGQRGAGTEIFISNVNLGENDNPTGSVEELENGSTLRLTLPLTQIRKDVESGLETPENLYLKFDLTKDDLNGILNHSIGLEVNSITDSDNILIKTVGEGSSESGFNLIPGNNIQANIVNSNLQISATDTTYSLEANVGNKSIGFKNSVSKLEDGKITFKAGEKIVNTVNENKEVTYSHGQIELNSSISNENLEPSLLGDGQEVLALKDISGDGYGHIEEYTPIKIKLDNTIVTGIESGSGTDSGKLKINTKKASSNLTNTINSDKILYYTVGKDTKVSKYNTEDLNVYTIDEIDKMLVGLNALIFKGTVGDSIDNKLPTNNVQAGWTYRVVDSYTVNNVLTATDGDLLIATGEEDETTGYLTSINWEYIPSGDDIDTKYTIITSNNQILLRETSGSNLDVAKVTLTPKNDDIEISTSNAGNNASIDISHKEYDSLELDENAKTAVNLTNGGTLSVVSGIETANGHITDVAIKNYTLPTIPSYTLGIDTENKALLFKEGALATSLGFVSGNNSIAISANQNSFSINHKEYEITETEVADTQNLVTNGTFTAVTGVSGENGHIENLELTTFTLPSADTLSTTINNDGFTIHLQNGGLNIGTANLKFASDSLNITKKDNGINFELEWGSF